MVMESTSDFFKGQPKNQMAKISVACPERLIDTVYYTANMYKVEFQGKV